MVVQLLFNVPHANGSVSAERAAMKREEAELKAKIAAQAQAERELQELGAAFPDLGSDPQPKVS